MSYLSNNPPQYFIFYIWRSVTFPVASSSQVLGLFCILMAPHRQWEAVVRTLKSWAFEANYNRIVVIGSGFSERYPCFCSRPLHRSCSFPCKPLWGWVPSHCTMCLYIALRISKSTKCNLADPAQFWLKFENFSSLRSKSVQKGKNIPICYLLKMAIGGLG